MKLRHIILAVVAIMTVAACHRNNGQEVAVAPVVGDGTVSSLSPADPDYDTYFAKERLRIDLVLAGNRTEQYAYLEELHKEASWSGSPNSLIDRSGYGQYFYEAFVGETLVFSKGFSTLFEEWRTTPQADEVSMAANQTVWMPFPKQKVHFVLYQRVRATGMLEKFFEFDINPEDTHIIPGPDNNYNVVALQYKGESSHKVDLVFAGEGYTEKQMPKLRQDARRMMEYLFSLEPYKSRRDDFNVWLVQSISKDPGVDIPNWGQWRNTAMDSMFDTFYEDRYLTIQNHKKIASVVSGANFDTIMIIANETKYGGGGIYGSYAMGTSDNELSDIVFVHEFGHSFAALGDEYYTSAVAYEDYYPAGVEPWEPNITNQTDFNAKWADMVAEGTPLPTPDEPEYDNVVGLFEGAGYMAKGCWRPYRECRMLNNTAPGFCPVCQRAISRMIDYYTK
ncbi:MAG: IgA Peptidase M64 [Bacteroidales bacterium]|nr:IgA Peptidase M64 [Bacteroidales bacterium]